MPSRKPPRRSPQYSLEAIEVLRQIVKLAAALSLLHGRRSRAGKAVSAALERQAVYAAISPAYSPPFIPGLSDEEQGVLESLDFVFLGDGIRSFLATGAGVEWRSREEIEAHYMRGEV